MADTAEQEISKRYAETVVLANNNDFEAFASVYTEDGILMAVGVEPSHGRADICTTLTAVIPHLQPMILGDTFHFELLSQNVAVVNRFLYKGNAQGEHVVKFKDFILWKKLNGKWYIHLDMLNICPKKK